MKKVLIVEDETVSALFLKNIFEKENFSVIGTAKTAEEAIKLATSKNPDLIIMDINLNGNINGIEAMNEIKKERNIKHIYCSAYNDEDTILKAKQTNPIDYIIKPVDPDTIKNLLKKI